MYGEPLGDSASNVMPNDACVVDAKRIEECDRPHSMPGNRDVVSRWPVAPAIAEQVEDDEPSPL